MTSSDYDIARYNEDEHEIENPQDFGVILIDRSTSMNVCDYPSKKFRTNLQRRQAAHTPHDISQWIAIGAYNSGARIVTDGFVDPVNLYNDWDRFEHDFPEASGCTNFSAPLHRACELMTDFFGQPRTIVLLTDGQAGDTHATLGEANHIKKNGIAIETVGIGPSPTVVNEDLLKEISSNDADGNPRYHFLDDAEKLLEHAKDLAKLIWRG